MSFAAAKPPLTMAWKWIFGPKIDLFAFFLPVLLSIPLWYFGQSTFANTSVFWMVMAATGFGIGPIHASATWYTFFDKKNRAYYASSWQKQMIYIYLPPMVLIATTVLAYYQWAFVLITFTLWTVQHLCQQNVGILLLYHRGKTDTAVPPRWLEARSIQTPTLLFTMIMARSNWLGNNPGIVYDVLMALCALMSVYFVGRYVYELDKLVRRGATFNIPAAGFWLVSVFMFLPFAFLPNGFLISLIWHWCQYIGLNLSIIGNKYATAEIDNLPEPHPFLLFFIIAVVFVLVYLGLPYVGVFMPAWSVGVRGALMGLGNAHYFLDAFMWRFRDPFPRQNVLPYIRVTPAKGEATPMQ